MPIRLVLAEDNVLLREGLVRLFSQTDEGIQAARHLRKHFPQVGVVVLSQYATPAYALEELVSARSRKPRSPLDQLTTREREILAEIASGKSNVAIASMLFLSERAIEKHSNSIFSKLGLSAEPNVNRRVKAVLLYLAAERPELS